MKRHTSIPLVALLLACSVSCSGPHPESSGTDVAFANFTDRYFQSYFEFHPTEATSVGLHQHDYALEKFSYGDIQNRVGALRVHATELAELRRRELPAAAALDAAILENRIAAELLDLETIRDWRRNPLMYAVLPGAAIDGLMKRNFAAPKARIRAITSRLGQVPALLNAMHDNTAQVPVVFGELAIRVLRGSIPFFRDTVPEWVKSNAGNDTVLLAEFSSAHRQALVALQMAVETLQAETVPGGSNNFAIGEANFSRKLQLEEMVNLPLPRLLEIGEENLRRDYAAFVETAKRIDAGRSAADVMQSISAQHPGEKELIPFASATAERIRQFVVDKKIIPIPSEVRPSILPTPPYARAGSFASMDTPGAYETSAREAFYYITPVEPEWTPEHKDQHLRLFSRPVMDMITVHEAYPGHYVQFLYAKEFPTKTRKLTSCGTNAEGWAHYAEQMMVEEGFGQGDPKIRLAQLSEALVRDVRYVAGIRLHTQGMTIEQAKDLFHQKAFLTEANALEEAQRGAYNPTYLYYTLGKLEIYKLREDYAKRKGGAFSLGDFHREFVRQGAIPIPLIRQIMLPGDTSPSL